MEQHHPQVDVLSNTVMRNYEILPEVPHYLDIDFTVNRSRSIDSLIGI